LRQFVAIYEEYCHKICHKAGDKTQQANKKIVNGGDSVSKRKPLTAERSGLQPVTALNG